MKLKQIALGVMSALCIGIFNPAQAEIIVYSNSGLNDVDLCSKVAGEWKGGGKLQYGLTCEYTGTAHVKNSSDKLDMTVELKRKSGSIVCRDMTVNLSGGCKNGAIIIKDNHIDLHGNMREEGSQYTANLEGFLSYLGLKPKVTIDLNKPK